MTELTPIHQSRKTTLYQGDASNVIRSFPKKSPTCYKRGYLMKELFSHQKSRYLKLELTRLTDPDRLQQLLVVVVLAYLWIMEVGAFSVASDIWKQMDNKGAARSVSLCQIGFRWVAKCLTESLQPSIISLKFNRLAAL